jgi:hypothetical protein
MLVMRAFQTHGQSVTRVEHSLKPFGCFDSDSDRDLDYARRAQRHTFIYICQTLLVGKVYFKVI